jgi:hypothetical protein
MNSATAPVFGRGRPLLRRSGGMAQPSIAAACTQVVTGSSDDNFVREEVVAMAILTSVRALCAQVLAWGVSSGQSQ